MSRAVRPLPDSTDPQVPAIDDTGRFAIDSNARTMLPPANENAADVLSLEDVGGTFVEPAPRTAPPPPPAASARPHPPASGVFGKGKHDADPDAALVESLISLRPIYSPTESAEAERAVLEVEDLSLRPDNPYLASSLVPPTDKRSGSRALLWIVPFVALAGIGAWLLAAQPSAPRAASTPSARLASKPSAASTETVVAAAANGPTETAVAVAVEPEAAGPSASETVEPPALSVRATPASGGAAPTEQSAEPRPRSAARVTASAPAAIVPAGSNPAQPAELPLVPSREQVAAGFEAVRAQLEQCAGGQHGVAQIAATIAATGRISHALVEGPFAGTPEGSCMARAVRAARFPSFSQASLKVAYPVAF